MLATHCSGGGLLWPSQSRIAESLQACHRDGGSVGDADLSTGVEVYTQLCGYTACLYH